MRPNHYPALRVNGQAMDIFMKIAANDKDGIYAKGFAVSAQGRNWSDLMGTLMRSIDNQIMYGGLHPREAQRLTAIHHFAREMRDAMVENARRTDNRHPLAFQAGADRALSQVQHTVDHELDHLVQYHATGGETKDHTDPATFFQHPLIQLADAYLRQNEGLPRRTMGKRVADH